MPDSITGCFSLAYIAYLHGGDDHFHRIRPSWDTVAPEGDCGDVEIPTANAGRHVLFALGHSQMSLAGVEQLVSDLSLF